MDGNEFAFLFFSEKLYADTMARKNGNAEKLVREGAKLEKKLTSGRKHKSKKIDLQAFVAEIRTSLQHRLKRMTQHELVQKILEKSIDEREGFFPAKIKQEFDRKRGTHILSQPGHNREAYRLLKKHNSHQASQGLDRRRH